jgi:hypothetical protein
MRTSFISYLTSAGVQVAGLLRTPREPAAQIGAVLICHGSDGIDGRGEYYAGALNTAGLATLEGRRAARPGVRARRWRPCRTPSRA